MILEILLAWIGLGALAVLFLYCCSRVSNGPRPEQTENDTVLGDRRSRQARMKWG